MTVEHPQAPGRKDQEAGHRKHEADRAHGEREPVHRRALRRVLQIAGHQNRGQRARGEEAEQRDPSGQGAEQAEDRPGEASRVFVATLLAQPAVDRNEGGGERALAEQVLEEIGAPQREAEDVGEGSQPEGMSEDALAEETDQSATKNAGRDPGGAAAGRSG